MSLLLLLTAGLQLFAHQTLRHSSAATIILALVLATWSYVLGPGLVLFLSVGWPIEWLHLRVKRAAMNASQAVLHGKGSADALVTMGERVQKVAWGGSIFPMVPGHLPAFAKDRMSISRVLVRQIGRTRGGWSEPSPGVLPNPDWVPADMIGHTTEEWVNLSTNGRAKNKPIVL